MSAVRGLLVASLVLALHGIACAMPHEPVVVAGSGCPANDALGGLTVRSVRVETPLAFLPWIRSDIAKAQALVAPLLGAPYRAEAVHAIHREISQLPFARLDLQARVGARLVAVDVACGPQGLDLAFIVFSTQVLPSTGITWEAGQQEAAAPERQSGQDAMRPGTRWQARLGYQTTRGTGGTAGPEGLGGGASALYRRSGAAADAYWNSLVVDAYASEALHDVSWAVEGSREQAGGTWARTAWRLGYADVSAPAQAVSRLDQRSWQAQLIAQSHPLGAWGLPIRLGAELGSGEYGTGRSADQHYQSLKLMAGTTTRLARHSLAASYAVEFGAGGADRGADWVKQIADLAHDGRWRVGDHRSLSLQTRLSFGQLNEAGPTPDGVRFFAGGREQWFNSGQAWQIRAGPLLRGLGTNAIGGDATHPGYRRFAALNLTAALPVFNRPLVPAELYRNPQVMLLLDSQLDSAVGALAADMRPELPSYRQAIAHLPQVQQTLATLAGAVDEAVRHAAPADAFAACRTRLTRAQADVAQVLSESGITQLGFFTELLPGEDSSDTLGQVVLSCATNVDAMVRPPKVTEASAALQASIARLVGWFAAADPAEAEQAARREIEPVRHIVHTLVDDTNAVAVSPLLMLDVATLGPDANPRPRVGLGAGLRVTLVDSVDFSVGYMRNLRRAPEESRGALFLAVEFKDPF